MPSEVPVTQQFNIVLSPTDEEWFKLSPEGMLDRYRALEQMVGSIARLEIQWDESASRDSLTDLWNKGVFMGQLEQRVGDGLENFGVICIDLSSFKNVNDARGHQGGDEILQKSSEVLRRSLRAENPSADHVAHLAGRTGGDEFAILCDLRARRDLTIDTRQRLQAIVDRLRHEFEIMTSEEDLAGLGFNVAIGSSLYRNGMSATELFKQADGAMYRNKRAQRRQQIDQLTPGKRRLLRDAQKVLAELGVRVPEEILGQKK